MYKKKIDMDLRIAYFKIFRKNLKNKESWCQYEDIFENNHIDIADKKFIIFYYSDENCFKISNFDYTPIHIFKINFFDFRTKILLYKLKKFMKYKDTYKQIVTENTLLRQALGQKYERSQKLKTINKKSS